MRALLLSFALLAAAPAAARAEPVPPPPAAPGPTIIGAWPDVPPPILRLHLVQQPDWSDPNIYPAAAASLDEEGHVFAETIVGKDGVPRACRVVRSSGHVELDEGTCQLMLQMRFEPPHDAQGRSAESLLQRGISWSLNDALPLAPARLVVHLTTDGKKVVGCTFEADGPVPHGWKHDACDVVRHWAYQRSAGNLPAATAMVAEIQPAGSPPSAAPPPPGRLVASRRTEFDIDDEGDPTNCRRTRDDGFNGDLVARESPCGFFASAAWFDTDKAAPGSLHGAVEVHVYVGETPPQ